MDLHLVPKQSKTISIKLEITEALAVQLLSEVQHIMAKQLVEHKLGNAEYFTYLILSGLRDKQEVVRIEENNEFNKE